MSDVLVYVTNTYVCGRESEDYVRLPAPPEGIAEDSEEMDTWVQDVAHAATGDGHPCGSREHAFYEIEIVEAPGRPELVGFTYDWEG